VPLSWRESKAQMELSRQDGRLRAIIKRKSMISLVQAFPLLSSIISRRSRAFITRTHTRCLHFSPKHYGPRKLASKGHFDPGRVLPDVASSIPPRPARGPPNGRLTDRIPFLFTFKPFGNLLRK
ncbi:hypothetical protein FRB98_003329, partial [Tulasnella sp. 332]